MTDHQDESEENEIRQQQVAIRQTAATDLLPPRIQLQQENLVLQPEGSLGYSDAFEGKAFQYSRDKTPDPSGAAHT